MADRIQFRRDTLANWQAANPILMDGELALIATDSSKPGVYDSKKVGDGVHHFNDLEMLGYECLQELGNSTIYPVSQKVITDFINKGYQFKGIATPETNPGIPNNPVFYITAESGNYINFGHVIGFGSFTVFLWNGTDWNATQLSQFDGNTACLIGENDTIVKANAMPSLPIGVPIRFYIKNPNVDYTGVTVTGNQYDRFVIGAINSSGELIAALVRLDMNSKTALAPYYDVTLPEGTDYIIITMRATAGFEQKIWTSGTALIDDLKTGGSNVALTAEQGKVLSSLQSKISIIGEDNNLVRSNYIKGLITGHIYRITINPNIDLLGVTVTGNQYDLFSVVLYSDETYEDSSIKVKISTQETLSPYYDVLIPEEYNYAMRISARATAGAEQIVIISDITDYYDTVKNSMEIDLRSGKSTELIYNDANVLSTGKQLKLLNNNVFVIGSNISDVPTQDLINIKNIIIDLPAPDTIAWLEIHNHYNTSVNAGSFIVDKNNTVLNVLCNKKHTADNMAVQVPVGAKRIVLSLYNNNKPTIICHPYNECNRLVNDIYGAERKITSFMSMSSLQSSGFLFNENLINTFWYNWFNYINFGERDAYVYLVPVYGYKTLRCTHFRTNSSYGSVFVDENMRIVGGIISKKNSEDGMTDYIAIPNGAKFFYYCVYKSVSVDPYVELSNSGIIETGVKNQNEYINGDISDGSIVASKTSLVLPEIPMNQGFHISLNEGYEFKSAHLCYNGSIVCTDYQPSPHGGDGNIMTPFEYFNHRVFSINQILPQFSIRLVVIKSNGSEIYPTDLFIKEKTIIDYRDFTRMTADNIPSDKAAIVKKRINQFLNVVWKAEEDIYPANPGDYKFTHYKKGRTYISTPYSEASEYSKYLGWCVSFRTFLSALMNKRSVMYTERISSDNKHSAYGIDYNGLGLYYANPYYGSVCTGLTQYALNLPNLYISSDYHAGHVPNTSKIEGATSATVQPLDYLWNEGHCSIISDILLDEEGNRKFIVWAEQTFPVTKNTVYTLEEFDKRCADKSIEVWRYNNWDSVTEPEATPYIQSSKYEWQTPIAVDEDFHLFCGDYAAFTKGDPIFFNANRAKGYTTFEVYNESDDSMSNALATISLSSLSNDGLYPDDEGDWVKIDFTSNSLPAGKYKARITFDDLQSGFVHFEIVEVTLNATISSGGDSTDISYSCSQNGTPVLIRRERINGMYDGIIIITEQDKEGTKNINWTDYSVRNYIKIYVKCDYGIVVKRVNMLN